MLDEFYRNPGAKIKKVINFIILVVLMLLVIAVIVTLFTYPEAFLPILLISVVSFIALLISYLFLYAFGDLVERTSYNAWVNSEILRILKSQYGSEEKKPLSGKPLAVPPGGWRCQCGRVHYPYVSSCSCGKNKWDVTGKTE